MWLIACFFILTLGAIISWLGYFWSMPLPDGDDRLSLVGDYVGVRAVILYLIMLIGILSRGVHDYIQNFARISFLAALRNAIHSSAFLAAMLVSPLVYFAL